MSSHYFEVGPFPWASALADLSVAGLVALALWLIRQSRVRFPYPPGPPGLPIVGNLLDIPTQDQWVLYAQWAREYKSPVIHLKIPGSHIIVLNDLQALKDIFGHKVANLSRRPRMPFVNESLGLKWSFGFGQDMTFWRAGRREIDARFRQSSVRQYQPQQKTAIAKLLYRLLKAPHAFEHHFIHCTAALILDITYGIEVEADDDEYIRIADKALDGLKASGGTSIIDLLPWLQALPSWLPGLGWKQQVDEWRAWTLRARDAPFDFTKERMRSGTAKACFTTDMLENFGLSLSDSWREHVIKGTVGSVYIGGSDTTAATMKSFILAMLLNPAAQSKAQAELDRVVGSHRLPNLSDEPELPYISAILKEVHRWFTLIPIVTPKENLEDEIYNGYLIPKGSTILINTWSITYNPDRYPLPESFIPERWLTPDGQLDPKGDIDFVFGFGKRICPGRFMASDVLWLTAACILSVFRITPKAGHPLPSASGDFEPSFARNPPQFQCEIQPRSEAAAKLCEPH